MIVKKLYNSKILKKLHNLKNNLFVEIYESEILLYNIEYDEIINNYVKNEIKNQKFLFIIFDSEILNNNLILLTSIGLILLKLINDNNFTIISNEIFNINSELKDKFMNIKINKNFNIFYIYSNTNLLCIYKIENEKIIKLKNIILKKYIRNINLFEYKNNFLIFSILEQNNINYSIENFYFEYKNNIIENINIEENINLKNFQKNFDNLNKIINDSINNNKKIFDIYYEIDQSKYIFFIIENGFIIYKIENDIYENSQEENLNFKKEHLFKKNANDFIEYKLIKINNYINHIFIYEKKIKFYTEIDNIIHKMKLKKEDKNIFHSKSIKNFIYNNNNILILYDIKGISSIINIELDINNKEILIKNKYNYNINDNLISLDSKIIKYKQNLLSIFSLTGLTKNDSKIVKYIDGYNNINLYKNKNLNKIQNIIYCENNNENKKIFLFNYFNNSILYSMKPNYNLINLKEFLNQKSIAIYQYKNLHTYLIILSQKIIEINFIDADFSQINCNILKENFEYKILFSQFFEYKNKFFLIIYSSNNLINIINLDDFSIIFEYKIEFLSCLNYINDYNNNKFIILFGNFNGELNLLMLNYSENENKFIIENTIINKLKHFQNNYYSSPENIKIIYNKNNENFIFCSSKSNDIFLLNYKNNNLNIIFSDKLNNEENFLKISEIEKDKNEEFIKIILFNMKKSYNLFIKINYNNNEKKFEIEKYYKNKFIINFENKNEYLIEFIKISQNLFFYLTNENIFFSYFENLEKNRILFPIDYFNFENQKINKIELLNVNNNNFLFCLTFFNENNEKKFYIQIIDIKNNKNINNILIDTKINENLNNMDIENSNENNNNNNENYHNLNFLSFKIFLLLNNNNNVYISLCGYYSNINNDNDIENKGILYIFNYDIEKNILNQIYKFPNFPKILYDFSINDYFIITAMENYIGFIKYNIENENNFVIKTDNAKQIQFANKIIKIEKIKNNNNNLIIVDEKESIFLIEIFKNFKFNINGFEGKLRNIKGIKILDEKGEKIFFYEKNGQIGILNLNNNGIYNVTNEIDLKDIIINCEILDENNIIANSISGGIYLIKIYQDKNIYNLSDFQNKIFNLYYKINFNLDEINIYNCMMMNTMMYNSLVINDLINICQQFNNNQEEIKKNIINFDENIKLINFLNEEIDINLK